MIDLSALYEAPIDPAGIDFTHKPGKSCGGCIFSKQRIFVCNQAVEIALRASMPSCDDENVVYVLRVRDKRQLMIYGESHEEIQNS